MVTVKVANGHFNMMISMVASLQFNQICNIINLNLNSYCTLKDSD
jgi:hypothetical protein